MRKILLSLSLGLTLILVSSCGMIQAPVVPPYGAMYTNFSAPLELNSNGGKNLGSKRGESSAVAYFGLFAFGDSGVDAAMKAGGINNVKHFDYKYKNYLFGAYAKYTTVVYGD